MRRVVPEMRSIVRDPFRRRKQVIVFATIRSLQFGHEQTKPLLS
jgi:hypothetical protein